MTTTGSIDMAPPPPEPPHYAALHWRRKRRLTLLLLAIWLFMTFFVIYFARELDNLVLFGWPVSSDMAAQGVALIYLALIGVYNRRIRHMEADYRRSESDARDARNARKAADAK
jgi:putative solute:sodium symporter small subunit